ncbi:uracil/xanthine transporter [Paenibacillus filicis]|uniref:Uracil/xanthine transporter n=1 Tax=Paenibacillus gyeongsangnamensis TaxID=3388067 RepID=A0ABT4QFK8_9BACL|nr:uracil/xanthine transporter [Paenibacillus filicis]MCZ8515645.1 uracil/xanthine transporter [Paenibacillus filicis]
MRNRIANHSEGTGPLNRSASMIGLAGLQWFFFMFTNTVVVPLSLGAALHLPPEEIAASLQRSFLLTGLVCILQAWIGHRYAVMDGPAGVWWGLGLGLCSSAQSVGMSLTAVGGGLATGFLLSGFLMIVLGALGFGQLLKRLFSPIVMGVSLLLLTVQLTMNFFKGMIGLQANGQMDPKVAGLSVAVALLVGLIQLKGPKRFANYAILIGIIVGWIANDLWLGANQSRQAAAGPLFSLFPWGAPNLEYGIIVASVIVGLINMTNTVTALSTVEKIYGTQTSDARYKRSYALTGLFSMLSALFGLLPFGLFTSSVGLLESTKILERSALIAGAAMFALLGLAPSLSGFFSMMPSSIGNAVLFVAYLQMFGTALRTIRSVEYNSKTIFRVALPVLLGISIMNTPPQAFAAFPMFVSPLLSNGLVMGVLLSLVMENSVDWTKLDTAAPDGKKLNA